MTERMTQAQVAALLGWGRDKVRRLTPTAPDPPNPTPRPAP